MLLWVAINALAQQKISVSGIVTDENKEPVIGANVSVKDVPGLGTITDLNGRYVIKVEPYNRLVFSYIGYQSQEVLIKNQYWYWSSDKIDSDRGYYNSKCRSSES